MGGNGTNRLVTSLLYKAINFLSIVTWARDNGFQQIGIFAPKKLVEDTPKVPRENFVVAMYLIHLTPGGHLYDKRIN